MTDQPNQKLDLNRRDFIKGSSTATLMTMLGGVKLFAADTESTEKKKEYTGPKVKVGVIGLGAWGRELLNMLARMPEVEIAAICDTYPSALRRASASAPGAAQTPDYHALLGNAEISAVLIATPTHQHREIALAALQAGKHVYCEAPLAHTLDEARAIALAAKAAPQLIFQAGLQWRCDKQRRELIRTFRSGALGQPLLAKLQWHKKQSWRTASPNPEREAALNWRLDPKTSLGLVGEVGLHSLDQAGWFLNEQPVAVTGFGKVAFWEDGREVPDTIQAVFEFPDGVTLHYDATLANSYNGNEEIYYGSESAVLLRESDIWLFKEVDAKLLGWEVYFPKQQILDETGIVLKLGASKSVPADAKQKQDEDITTTALGNALTIFVHNAGDFVGQRANFIKSISDEPQAVNDFLAKDVLRRPAPGFLEGYQAVVLAAKANEAVLAKRRLTFEPQAFALA